MAQQWAHDNIAEYQQKQINTLVTLPLPLICLPISVFVL